MSYYLLYVIGADIKQTFSHCFFWGSFLGSFRACNKVNYLVVSNDKSHSLFDFYKLISTQNQGMDDHIKKFGRPGDSIGTIFVEN